MEANFNGIGTDIRSDWSFNEDGDLNLIRDNDNVTQAISNRLQTELDSLSLFYNSYGSVLLKFLGWRADESTLRFMEIEIRNRLSTDFRLTNFRVECEYTGDGRVRVTVSNILDTNEVYDSVLVLSKDGVSVDGD